MSNCLPGRPLVESEEEELLLMSAKEELRLAWNSQLEIDFLKNHDCTCQHHEHDLTKELSLVRPLAVFDLRK